MNEWKLADREDFEADEKNDHAYSFLTYERVAPAADHGRGRLRDEIDLEQAFDVGLCRQAVERRSEQIDQRSAALLNSCMMPRESITIIASGMASRMARNSAADPVGSSLFIDRLLAVRPARRTPPGRQEPLDAARIGKYLSHYHPGKEV